MARAIAVELPEEDGGGKDSECVGRYNSHTYFHTGKRIRVMVHGDDVVSAGSRSALEVENMRGREVLSCSCRTLATVKRTCKRTECSIGSSGQSRVVDTQL